jgi:TamB, inner membrane protein subunit of TAM complex
VSGTAGNPKIVFTSYPALPQEDIVSLLAFGYRGEDTRHVTGGDTSAITYSEVSSILMDQLQLSQNLQSKGLKVTVTPSVTDNEASLIKRDSAVTAAPKVSLQSQVVKNLDATLGGTVGAASGQNMDAKVEYHLSRRASVRGIYEQSASGIDASDTKNSYGADLRFRWEFK